VTFYLSRFSLEQMLKAVSCHVSKKYLKWSQGLPRRQSKWTKYLKQCSSLDPLAPVGFESLLSLALM
jgi:hypothetical protein